MKGIVGRKLGMTQLFDEESGVVTPVTVIQAGPCPVVQVKTVELDGYEAVQLAFDPVAERKLSKAEVGHLKKASVEPHRHLVEFRGASELLLGESVTVEAFEPGDSIKVAGMKWPGRCDTRSAATSGVSSRNTKPRPGKALRRRSR